MSGRSFWQLTLFLVVVTLGGWGIFRQFATRGEGIPAIAAKRFAEEVAQLKAANPDYVIIGDSMLATRMDADQLSKISGKRFFFYCEGGASSAAWYLYLKNVVIGSGVKPRAVLFMFRNQYLTWPRFRVDGLYQSNLDRVSVGKDELVVSLLMPDPPKPWQVVAWVRRWLVESGGLLYSKTASSRFHTEIEDIALDATSFGQKKETRRNEMADRFNFRKLRSDLAAELPEENTDNSEAGRPRVFNPAPEKSFLPHIVALAKEHHLALGFFRVKCRPDKEGITHQSEEMTEYSKNLRAWMAQEQCLFFDETNDPSITLAMYHDGDHLSEAYKPWWTEYFWKRMSPLLP